MGVPSIEAEEAAAFSLLTRVPNTRPSPAPRYWPHTWFKVTYAVNESEAGDVRERIYGSSIL